MGQQLFDTDNYMPRIMTILDSLRIDTEQQTAQLVDENGVVIKSVDTQTGELRDSCWPLKGVTDQRLAQLAAETMAKSHGWIVSSAGGSPGSYQFDFMVASSEHSLRAIADISYLHPARRLIAIDSDNGWHEISIPLELGHSAYALADLIAASFGQACSKYSHPQKTTTWRKKD